MTFSRPSTFGSTPCRRKAQGAQCKDCAQNVNREIKGMPPWNVIHETGN